MASAERGADIIVVGSGAAGCVVARRLHDAGASVLVLEAGGGNDDARIVDAARSYELSNTAHDWAFRTVPQRNIGGRILAWPRGRALGGSSSTNALVWIRGCREDYDAWAYPGNPGWSYSHLLPLFKRIEDFDRGDSEFRGAGGPMPVITEYERGPVHKAVIDGMCELGISFNDDHNAREIFGTGWCQFNVRGGKRVSAANAYLEPVLDSPRMELVTSALVTRLLIERGRCIGVEWISDGVVQRAHAEQEVVLSGGVIGSPTVLLLSGIGPADELVAVGIDVAIDLPGVGRNLQDHVYVPMLYATTRAIDPPVGVPAYQTNTFIRTDPAFLTPSIQAPSLAFLPDYPGLEYDCEHGFLVAPTLMRTASRGQLRLSSADPGVPPLIDPATFDGPGDVTTLVAGMRALKDLAQTEALREWGARQMYPDPRIEDDRELEAYTRQVVSSASHPVATCKMGVDAEAVVDPSLRVYGVDGLRIADASIMPTVVTGNTHVASLVIGEKAADILLAALS